VAISVFYAAGTALGRAAGPPLYGTIIEKVGSREALFGAYALSRRCSCAALLSSRLWLGVDASGAARRGLRAARRGRGFSSATNPAPASRR